MPRYRPDIDAIPRYVPGRPIEDVVRELGITSIDKLASNEHPEPPFPEVLDAINSAADGLNRYPDSGVHVLRHAIAEYHGVPPESVWVGAGSSEILRCSALAVGGPGTSAVYASPSFVMYAIGTMISGAEPVTVPLTHGHDHDLDAMLAALREDTTMVYVCNPNNPTGGFRSGDDVESFISEVPTDTVLIIDEAYAEYVTDPTYRSMIHQALDTPNVLVTRTFSKVYGLAGLRVGYGIGDPDMVSALRTTQAPFSVTTLGQVAALEALRHDDLVGARAAANATGREALVDGLTALGYLVAPTQANFVYFEPEAGAAALGDQLLSLGIIVRVLGEGVRVSVGTVDENERFLAAMGDLNA